MGFHDIRFPLRLALGTSGGPVRRTDIVNLSNGRESRNRRWQDSRRAYDAGSGVRSVGDLYQVLEFFEARGGALYGFRFRDPVDFKSCRPDSMPAATDQPLGTGDGVMSRFQLVKTYGDAAGSWERQIAKPVAQTVKLAVNGQPMAAGGFTIDSASGAVTFLPGFIPAAGWPVTAGFEFDVPVRFATDRLEINLEAFEAGRIPTIPLLEILP